MNLQGSEPQTSSILSNILFFKSTLEIRRLLPAKTLKQLSFWVSEIHLPSIWNKSGTFFVEKIYLPTDHGFEDKASLFFSYKFLMNKLVVVIEL